VLFMLKIPADWILPVICGALMPLAEKTKIKEITSKLGIGYQKTKIDDNEYKINFV
tara:strand:+ start:7882 stop:8049 length:168 start_codon:yes stop_codon:yes gene_type:complete